MNRKRERRVSLDAMTRFILKSYDIPTKKDVEKIIARIDQIEKLVVNGLTPNDQGLEEDTRRDKNAQHRSVVTATDMVLGITKTYENGVSFKEIQLQTGFNEKKIRNIIFRLDKLGKIKRVDRGTYTAV